MSSDQLTEHFKRSEFACKCGCGFDDISIELVEVLEDVRQAFNTAVFVTSGCRCKKHNKAVGGAKASKHMLGIAADIKLGVHPHVVAEYLDTKYSDKYGIIIYPTWVHVDTRKEKYREDKRE